MELLLSAKVTPDVDYLLLVYAVQEPCSSLHVRGSFWSLIITQLNWRSIYMPPHFLVRECLYEKKLVPLSGISRSPRSRWYGKSFLFSLCVNMIKRAGSLTEISPLKGEISVSGMNRNPYKHFSPPTKVNFNRGVHAYDIQIQTIMAFVKSITRHKLWKLLRQSKKLHQI